MRCSSFRSFALLSAFCLTVAVAGRLAAQEQPAPAEAQGEAAAPAAVSFSKDVAPILLKNCTACHGANDPKGDFQLHNFASLIKPGASTSPSITPGNLEESELVRLISSEDADERMPKDDMPLLPEQVELIKRWVTEGAAYDGADPEAALASIVPKEPHPPAFEVYRVPIPITALAWRPDGQELAVGGYHEITIWNPATGELLRRIGNVDQRTFGLAYNNDGTLLAAASGTPGVSGEVALFDPAAGTVVRVLASMSEVAYDVAFNPAGDRLAACGADRSIRFYEVATGTQQHLVEDHADWVMAIAWNHDGTRLASASRDKTSKLFDTSTGDSLATYPGHGEPVYGVAFSEDGAQVLTGGGNRMIHVWNPADGAKVAEIGGYGGDVYDVRIRQGMIFSCSGDKTARQHQVADRAQVRSFDGHADWVFSLAYNEATKRLATGSFDCEIRVWNAEDGASVVSFKAAPGLAPVATAAAGQ